MQVARVHSIETFGTVDGPGTRFVVFLKGCNLRCKYCHNPDTWKRSPDDTLMSVSDILDKYDSVKTFISGGLTVSGGEPLLQIDFLVELFKACKAKKIHTCLDTSGSTFDSSKKFRLKRFDELLKYTDLVLLDIKHIDPKEHIKLTNVSLTPVLEFAKYLDQKKTPIWIRHVVVPTITLDDKYLFQLGKYLKTLSNIEGLEVLPYHDMGVNKYEKLEIDYPLKNVRTATKEEALHAKKIILYAMNT